MSWRWFNFFSKGSIITNIITSTQYKLSVVKLIFYQKSSLFFIIKLQTTIKHYSYKWTNQTNWQKHVVHYKSEVPLSVGFIASYVHVSAHKTKKNKEIETTWITFSQIYPTVPVPRNMNLLGKTLSTSHLTWPTRCQIHSSTREITSATKKTGKWSKSNKADHLSTLSTMDQQKSSDKQPGKQWIWGKLQSELCTTKITSGTTSLSSNTAKVRWYC